MKKLFSLHNNIIFIVFIFIFICKYFIIPLIENTSLRWFFKDNYFTYLILLFLFLWLAILAIYYSLAYLVFYLLVRNPNMVLPEWLKEQNWFKEIQSDSVSSIKNELEETHYRVMIVHLGVLLVYILFLLFWFLI